MRLLADLGAAKRALQQVLAVEGGQPVKVKISGTIYVTAEFGRETVTATVQVNEEV